MTRILFVDDEPKILEGLRRMLRGMRSTWEMVFVDNASQALQALAAERFDIIVSDMRMPLMNGAQLLEQVRNLYPHTVRIILSGHSDQELIMKSVGLVHQYLAKPCDAEKLQKVLQRAATLRHLLNQGNLIGLVSRIEALPCRPQLHSTLLEKLDSEESSAESIGELVAQDMGMSATVLKLVNSSFFGLGHHIASPQQAVSFLGLDVIKGLVLSVGLFNVFKDNLVPGMSFKELWRHSLATAGFARKLMTTQKDEEPIMLDYAFLAGMLHDVGKLVLASVAHQDYTRVIQHVQENNQPVWISEQEIIGTSHAMAGAYLMGLWGVREEVMLAMAFHHRPVFSPYVKGRKGRLLMAIVHAANVLEHEMCVVNTHYHRPKIDQGFLSEAGLQDRLPIWRQACAKMATCEGSDAVM
jgi:HD-like signal output (HDOD) protein/CheY-like chemotaxis protein